MSVITEFIGWPSFLLAGVAGLNISTSTTSGLMWTPQLAIRENLVKLLLNPNLLTQRNLEKA